MKRINFAETKLRAEPDPARPPSSRIDEVVGDPSEFYDNGVLTTSSLHDQTPGRLPGPAMTQRVAPATIVRLTVAETDQLDGVASRMSATLAEVVGREAIDSLYTRTWLRDRALAHVDGRLSGGAVFVALDGNLQSIGHVIVRTEDDEDGSTGLISTIYVVPDARRRGIAGQLVDTAHAWFRANGLSRFATDTAQTNLPLIRLLRSLAYDISHRSDAKKMVRLMRRDG